MHEALSDQSGHSGVAACVANSTLATSPSESSSTSRYESEYRKCRRHRLRMTLAVQEFPLNLSYRQLFSGEAFSPRQRQGYTSVDNDHCGTTRRMDQESFIASSGERVNEVLNIHRPPKIRLRRLQPKYKDECTHAPAKSPGQKSFEGRAALAGTCSQMPVLSSLRCDVLPIPGQASHESEKFARVFVNFIQGFCRNLQRSGKTAAQFGSQFNENQPLKARKILDDATTHSRTIPPGWLKVTAESYVAGRYIGSDFCLRSQRCPF